MIDYYNIISMSRSNFALVFLNTTINDNDNTNGSDSDDNNDDNIII